MKLTVFLLVALFAISRAEPSCDIDSMCMGCDATTADKCTACYNGVVATYGARYLKTDACANKLTTFTDCDVYNPKLTDATAANTASPNASCYSCGNSKVLTFTPGSSLDLTSSAGMAPLVSTISGVYSCATQSTDMTSCATIIYVNSTGNAKDGCLISSAGTCGASAVDTAPTSGACSNHENCNQTIWEYASGANTPTFYCHNAKSNFAVKSDRSSGVSYTTDTNCRQLLADGTNCGMCTDGYWFGGAKCYMRSGMLFMSAAAFLVAMLF